MNPSQTRADIRRRLAAGQKPAEIALALGVAKSTVYRARNTSKRPAGDAAGYAVVSARLAAKENDALDRLVRAGIGRSRGAVMRRLIRAAAGFYSPRPEEEAFLSGADLHLSRLGGNFNQIAAALSASVRKIGKADPTAEQVTELRAAAREVREIRAIIRQLLANSQQHTSTLAEAIRANEPVTDSGSHGVDADA